MAHVVLLFFCHLPMPHFLFSPFFCIIFRVLLCLIIILGRAFSRNGRDAGGGKDMNRMAETKQDKTRQVETAQSQQCDLSQQRDLSQQKADRIPGRKTFILSLALMLVIFQSCSVAVISPAISSSVFIKVMQEADMHPDKVSHHVDAQGGNADSMVRASSGDVNYVLYTARTKKDADGIASHLDDRLISLGASKIVLPAIGGRRIMYTLPDDSSYSITTGSNNGSYTVLIGHGVYQKDRKTMRRLEHDIREASLKEH